MRTAFVVLLALVTMAAGSGCGDDPPGPGGRSPVMAPPSRQQPPVAPPETPTLVPPAVPPGPPVGTPVPGVDPSGHPPTLPPIAPPALPGSGTIPPPPPLPPVPGSPPDRPGPPPGTLPPLPDPSGHPVEPPPVPPPLPLPPGLPALPESGAGDPKSPTDGWTDPYVGPNACQKCHFAETKAWKKTPHAKALEALRPTAEADADRFRRKRDAGLDPWKDYTSDAACVPCHVTGHAAEGGFPALTSSEPANPSRAKAMGAVTCEACHGPGGLYVEHKTAEIARDKDMKFPAGSLAPYGLSAPDAATCRRCHNERSPTHKTSTFDFATDKAKVHPVPK